jgi:hypothetical protein
MVSEEKLKHYAVNFLDSEIDEIHKTLEFVKTDGERRLLTELVRDYRRDLAEIEDSLEG